MLTLHTLASGSSGNALLVDSPACHILVDAGISCRRIAAALSSLQLSVEDLDAVVMTHAHSDHMAGLETLAACGRFPIYAAAGTCEELEAQLPALSGRLVPVTRTFQIADVTVSRFPTSHDSPGSSGYRLDMDDFSSIGILSDSGCVTGEARRLLTGVPLLVLESNYDPDMLARGPYPAFLKRRVSSRKGHLSNPDAASFACESAWGGTREVLLTHLSEKNNTPALALRTVTDCLKGNGIAIPVSVAPRSDLSRAYTAAGALAGWRLACSG